jgi:hypothetical protein
LWGSVRRNERRVADGVRAGHEDDLSRGRAYVGVGCGGLHRKSFILASIVTSKY